MARRRDLASRAETGGMDGARRVAVVDSNPLFLGLVRSMVADDHYRVTVHTVDDNPYRSIRDELPDLVILDLRVGGVLDWQLLTMLKLDPKTADVPVLICSAGSPELLDLEERLHAHGCELLLKPFGGAELVAAVQRLTDRASEIAA